MAIPKKSSAVKKKNWFERIAEIDARQQAEIDKHNKKLKKSNSMDDIKLSKSTRVILLSLTISLPILAWIAGSFMNPSGWMSGDITALLTLIILMPVIFWFLSIPALILIIYLLIKRKKDAATVLIFMISLVASLFVGNSTASANESEFTG